MNAKELCSNPGCSKESTSGKCQRCHRVRYCSAECQKQHFPAHKADCKLIGEAFAATKDLEKKYADAPPPISERGVCVVSKAYYVREFGKKGWKEALKLHGQGECVPEHMSCIHANGQSSYAYLVPQFPAIFGYTAAQRMTSKIMQAKFPTEEQHKQGKFVPHQDIAPDPHNRTAAQQEHIDKLVDIAVSALQKNRHRTDLSEQFHKMLRFMTLDLESKLTPDEVQRFRQRVEGPEDPKFYSEDPEYTKMDSGSASSSSGQRGVTVIDLSQRTHDVAE